MDSSLHQAPASMGFSRQEYWSGLPMRVSRIVGRCFAVVKDLGSIPGLGRSPGEGNGNPLQYSCLENPMDTGAWCRLLSMGSQRVGHD